MKLCKSFLVLLISVALCVAMSASALAHSGRTDSSGGHRDNKNASGLGSYHYHHGNGPHLHTGGVCPYTKPAPTVKPAPAATPAPAPVQPEEPAPETTATAAPTVPASYEIVDVILGKINLVANGQNFGNNTLLYNDTVYVPLRVLAEALGKEVLYDPEGYIVHINEPAAE